MGTGFGGTFVISWSQTKVDGIEAAPTHTLDVGTSWSWHGDAVRVDGPQELLRLEQADGEANLRRSAARMVRRLVGAARQNRTDVAGIDVEDPIMDSNVVVTDGTATYTLTMIEVGEGAQPLLMFLGVQPPKGRELWVVHHTLDAMQDNHMTEGSGGVICFTPGTRIETPKGARLVQELREGDLVQTKDNGAQEVLWVGSRRMTGARLFAMPHLRPIRISAGALGVHRPDQELLVSPSHRMLVRGQVSRALFNTPEVLIAASDLIDGHRVRIDSQLKEVTYIHLLLSDHQILWANGVETESFHPSNAALSSLDDTDRMRLLARYPEIEADPQSYGGYARRNLSRSEAAILMHEAA
ncbi:Hint domain-containing protein [Thalassobius sp. MITS945101]|uniref:Hint domain-containing protein n=1 Tax=Thalassobius sp. MITS945101 TaxID=3096994 RepID=UPI00399C05FF